VLDELSAQYAGKVTVGKINVDNEGELAQEFSVSSIPTLLVMKDGKEVNRYVGVTAKAELARAVEAALG
jgi:thioredoxin 1